jgi:hypothetical protein
VTGSLFELSLVLGGDKGTSVQGIERKGDMFRVKVDRISDPSQAWVFVLLRYKYLYCN